MANSFCNYCHRLFYLFSILTTFSFLSFHFLKLPLFGLFQFMAYSLYSVFNFSHVLFHFISILTTISLLTFQFLTTCDWLLFNSCYVHFPSFWILATFTCWLQFAFFFQFLPPFFCIFVTFSLILFQLRQSFVAPLYFLPISLPVVSSSCQIFFASFFQYCHLHLISFSMLTTFSLFLFLFFPVSLCFFLNSW